MEACSTFPTFQLTVSLSFKNERQYRAKLSAASVPPSEQYMMFITRFSSSLSWVCFELFFMYGSFLVLFCFFFLPLFSLSPCQRLPAKARVVQLPPSAPAPPKGCHLSPAESPATSGIMGLKLKEGSPQALVVWAVNSTSKTTETRSVYGEASGTERLSTERSVQNLRRLASDRKIMPTGLHKALCD